MEQVFFKMKDWLRGSSRSFSEWIPWDSWESSQESHRSLSSSPSSKREEKKIHFWSFRKKMEGIELENPRIMLENPENPREKYWRRNWTNLRGFHHCNPAWKYNWSAVIFFLGRKNIDQDSSTWVAGDAEGTIAGSLAQALEDVWKEASSFCYLKIRCIPVLSLRISFSFFFFSLFARYDWTGCGRIGWRIACAAIVKYVTGHLFFPLCSRILPLSFEIPEDLFYIC